MYILTRPNLFPSAREIRDTILIKTNKKLHLAVEEKQIPPTIRWGNSYNKNKDNDTTLNPAGIIALCSNKRRFSAVMVENGIPHVQYYQNQTPEHFPIIIRTIVNGMGGEGIVICQTPQRFEESFSHNVWSYFYNFSFELGVHILGGEIARVFKKVREGEEEEFPIRNFHRGYSFSLKEKEKYPKLQEVVDKFYSAVPIQMSRLDVGWDSDSKIYRIIEANTAPSLSNNENTLDLYTNFMIERLGL